MALTADGTAYTAKNESADTKGADSTYTRGFHLAGVDIPYPTGAYVQKTGTTSLSDKASLCWVQRCTTEGKVAWVLSLVNGNCPAKKDISCGGGEPAGNCSDASYKLTHKSECCPSAPTTDTDCWTATQTTYTEMIGTCGATNPCGTMYEPSQLEEENISCKLNPLLGQCNCVLEFYSDGRRKWQYCNTSYEKNGW